MPDSFTEFEDAVTEEEEKYSARHRKFRTLKEIDSVPLSQWLDAEDRTLYDKLNKKKEEGIALTDEEEKPYYRLSANIADMKGEAMALMISKHERQAEKSPARLPRVVIPGFDSEESSVIVESPEDPMSKVLNTLVKALNLDSDAKAKINSALDEYSNIVSHKKSGSALGILAPVPGLKSTCQFFLNF